MKNAWNVFWGLGFVLIALALILDAVGVLSAIIGPFGEVSILALIGGLLLLAYAVSRLFKGKVGEIFLPLAFIFMIFEKNIAHVLGREDGNLINNGLLFGCACLMWLGFSILFSGLGRKKKKKNHIDIDIDLEGHSHMRSSVQYVNCDGFKFKEVENSFGSYTLYFENAESYEGDGVLEIDNSFGNMVINIPVGWRINMEIDNSFGKTTSPSQENVDGPVITIKGDNSFGNVSVKHV